ncbi:hypothetical protein DFH09DRAFT_1483890, partial [Mycena vulgaris]
FLFVDVYASYFPSFPIHLLFLLLLFLSSPPLPAMPSPLHRQLLGAQIPTWAPIHRRPRILRIALVLVHSVEAQRCACGSASCAQVRSVGVAAWAADCDAGDGDDDDDDACAGRVQCARLAAGFAGDGADVDALVADGASRDGVSNDEVQNHRLGFVEWVGACGALPSSLASFPLHGRGTISGVRAHGVLP